METMEIVTKESAIIAFKNGCVYPVRNILNRSIAVKTQFQRNIWEIFNENFGLVRIREGYPIPIIMVYPLLKNGFPEKGKMPYEFELTKEEYNELKDLYFGDLKEDTEYFKRWYKK